MSDVTTMSIDAKTCIDDLFWGAPTEAITETDAELEQIVDGAELPVLLTAIAAATGDLAWLGVGLEPPLPPADLTPHPHGGMTDDQQQRARVLALKGLAALRDERITTVDILPREQVDALLGYLTGGREQWHPHLTHELILAPDKGGAPDWRFADLADGRDYEVLIVGAGVGGIAAAHRFTQAGVPITVVESSAQLGGTWSKNHYPGVRLDTPTFGYSYSFAQRGDWPHQFAQGHEILEYLTEVAERAGVVERIEFSTTLVSAHWDEAEGFWRAVTRGADGHTQERRFSAIVSAVGQLDRPHIPEFDGLDQYRGIAMHTQEWRDDVDWRGARVAVIGTGASAYQVVPAAMTDGVGELVLFQRSAPWMLPAPNYHEGVSETFAWLQRKVPHYAQWYRLWVILLGIDGRTHTVTAEDDWDGAPLSVSARNQAVRDELIGRLAAQLDGRPDLLAHAIPNYPPGAKRMLRDNGVWAEALRSDRTTLVTSGIERFTPNGIVDGEGIEHDVDIVVFATGFTPSDYLDGIEVVGRNGVELHDFWGGDARAHACVTVPGFPSLFLVYGPNIGGVAAGSLHFMLERAAEYAVKSVRRVLEEGAAAIDVRPDALDRFAAWVDAGNERMAWGQPYVRSWYKNRHGRVSQIWPYTNADYWDATQTVRDEDHVFL